MMTSRIQKLARITWYLFVLGTTGCSFDQTRSGRSLSGTNFSEEPIVLETDTGKLFGTLALPPGAPPFDHLVLIISGSGPTDRNGNSSALQGRNDCLLQLAQSLAARGIASVRFDKRGIALSAAAGPDESALRFDTYVQDASAWLSYLRKDQRFRSVSVIGHSEGSLVGMLAASPANASAFISVAGASRPASLLLKEQLAKQLSPELQAQSDRILASLEAGELASDVPDELAALYHASVQPYLISWFKYDPSAEIRKVSAPILIVHGSTDMQVPVSDAQALHDAVSGSELAIVEGMNHVLKPVPADVEQQLASYSEPSIPIHAELVGLIADFL